MNTLRWRDILLTSIGFFVILLILKLTGVISPHATALGTAALMALILAIKVIPSRTMRVIAGFLVIVTVVSIVVPWILSYYFPYTKIGLQERRELTDLWLGEQTGGEVTSLALLRRNCRDMEDIILRHNIDVLKENLETIRQKKPFDPETFKKNIEKFGSIHELRKICSDHLKEKVGTQVQADHAQQGNFSWSMNKWFLFIGILLVALWFVGMFYAIAALHKSAVILIFVLLICWLFLGPGITAIENLFNSSEIAGQQPASQSETTTTVPVVKNIQRLTKGISGDLWMFIATVVFLIITSIFAAGSKRPRRVWRRGWMIVFIAYVLRILLWMGTKGSWENILKTLPS